MSLVGFKAQNHPQQVGKRGRAVKVDDRTTHPDDFGRWHERFNFTIDAAATADNARLPRYWTAEDDALSQSWLGERVWCNPPYSSIEPWVAKAWAERNRAHEWIDVSEGSRLTGRRRFRFCANCEREEFPDGSPVRRGGTGECSPPFIVMLLPANRTEQGWWQRQVEPFRDRDDFRIEFLAGRLRFIQSGRTEIGPNERPPFGCCLLIWGN